MVIWLYRVRIPHSLRKTGKENKKQKKKTSNPSTLQQLKSKHKPSNPGFDPFHVSSVNVFLS